MIHVDIRRDEQDKIDEIHCHADDVAGATDDDKFVEVGISTLLRTAVIGLESYLRLDPDVEDDEDRLVLRLRRDPLLNREIDAILETVIMGLSAIRERHPDHVTITDALDKVNV